MTPIFWSYPDTEKALARFTTGSVETVVSLRRNGRSWQLGFEVEGPSNEVAYSALEIFRGVFDALEQFLAVREPMTVLFATDRDDLAEIYRTYLEKESKRLTSLGYRLDSEHRVLRRFKPSRWAAPVEA
ncbi:MAG: hypothetical protein LAO79_10920 [Acidobacteriia bacterium]|nr:hypothetical protein [Terriglobia bacterium]